MERRNGDADSNPYAHGNAYPHAYRNPHPHAYGNPYRNADTRSPATQSPAIVQPTRGTTTQRIAAARRSAYPPAFAMSPGCEGGGGM